MKGIKKHKKERMVFDKEANEWRPRWGYKVINICVRIDCREWERTRWTGGSPKTSSVYVLLFVVFVNTQVIPDTCPCSL